MRKRSLKSEKARAKEVLRRLHAIYPDVECTLSYRDDPFRLMVGAILAAQCTDARVNKVTPGLFAQFPKIEDLAAVEAETIEPYIKSCGLFRNKAKHIHKASRFLLEEYGGVLPQTRKELMAIPGVGRKIANLLIGDVFGGQAIVVDTHCARLAKLLGCTERQQMLGIEKDLLEVVPEEEQANWGHLMVHHGRVCCVARRPNCEACVLKSICDHGRGRRS